MTGYLSKPGVVFKIAILILHVTYICDLCLFFIAATAEIPVSHK